MTTTQHDEGSSASVDFYVPGTAVLSEQAGRIERYLTGVYRRHRFRGGVTMRSE